jgi:hypothetical protein
LFAGQKRLFMMFERHSLNLNKISRFMDPGSTPCTLLTIINKQQTSLLLFLRVYAQ